MNNPYSKYRYDNSFNVKIRTLSNGHTDIQGSAMRGNINSQTINKQLSDSTVTSAPWGVNWIVNYVYGATRITNVDSTITPSSYKGPTFFKLFKL